VKKRTQFSSPSKNQNLLDRWIVSRLNRLIEAVTESLDNFDAARASLAIEEFFINDLSLWYIRRSRKRFQNPSNKKEKAEASAILYWVLYTLSKLIAPMMPFLAEEIYLNLKTKTEPQSVHLCDWPKADKKLINKLLEEEMAERREIVSELLAKRTELGIKVRQPLAEGRVRKPKSLKIIGIESTARIIMDEVNLKKVTFGKTLKLNTKISEELKEEGQVREFIRQVQQLRKNIKLIPKEKIIIYYQCQEKLKKVLEKNKKDILAETKAKDFIFGEKPNKIFDIEKDLKVDQTKLWLAIKKIK